MGWVQGGLRVYCNLGGFCSWGCRVVVGGVVLGFGGLWIAAFAAMTVGDGGLWIAAFAAMTGFFGGFLVVEGSFLCMGGVVLGGVVAAFGWVLWVGGWFL